MQVRPSVWALRDNSMLSKLENAYLYILRVVVLAAATLALIGVLVGLARSATFIADFVGSKPPTAEVPGGTLGDFVAEKRPQGVTLDSQPSSATPDVQPKIKAAVRSLAHYVRTRLDVVLADQSVLTSIFTDKSASLPTDEQEQYGASVAALMDQLDNSKGNPLSTEQIASLIEWHADKFKANAEVAVVQKQAAQVQAVQTLGVAGAGFGVFVALVFCFLIVKIERNLRIVHTIRAQDTLSEATRKSQV